LGTASGEGRSVEAIKLISNYFAINFHVISFRYEVYAWTSVGYPVIRSQNNDNNNNRINAV
jgi:hypothetical protein